MKQSLALSILKSGKNVFLTGSAGAGKTFVLNQYIEYLKDRKIAVAITASTGIAATHMNGMTIHAWSGIGVKEHLELKDLQFLKTKKYLKDKIEQVQVLIIDEISMLHKNQLDLVNRVLKYLKNNTLPFGGIQVVFSGDFFQLPPIGKQFEENRDKFAFMSESWLEAKPVICYLTEQYRQTDNTLNEVLNSIRRNDLNELVYDNLLKLTEKKLNKKQVVTRLYTHNLDVDRINIEELMKLKTDSKVFMAVQKGNEKLRDLLAKSVLTDAVLELRLGANVMFIKNNYEKNYMNGTLGSVMDFSEDGFPMVKLSDGTIIEAEPEDWKIQDENGKTLASFNQVPLRLAWAITVHKSQGMTLDAAEIDLSKAFEKGQGYVALSRLKDLNGLYLSGFNERSLQVDTLALKADKRFQELSNEFESKWTEEDLHKYEKAFILACGGLTDKASIEKNKKAKAEKLDKRSTFQLTEELVLKGLKLNEIAKERGLTESSILTHLEVLKNTRKDLSLEQFKPDEFLIQEVKTAIKELGDSAYTDSKKISVGKVYKHLDQKMTYTDLKLALLFV
jgi:ATP-dependent exoDNAse (exonuclease V) alpha subunit